VHGIDARQETHFLKYHKEVSGFLAAAAAAVVSGNSRIIIFHILSLCISGHQELQVGRHNNYLD
jgi:hypothetical protein